MQFHHRQKQKLWAGACINAGGTFEPYIWFESIENEVSL